MSDRGTQGGVLDPAADHRRRAGGRPRPTAASSWCRPSTEANVRWANNTVTTNGLATIAVAGSWWRSPAARPAPLPPRRRRRTRRSRWPRWCRQRSRRREAAARVGTGAGRAAADRARLRRRPSTSTSRRRRRRSTSSATCSARWQTAFDGARSGDRILYGFARHEVTHHLPGLLHRPAVALGAAHRTARGERQIRRPAPARRGPGCRPPTSVGVDVAAVDATLASRLDWATPHHRSAAGAVRHRAAADRGRRLHDLPGLERRRPARARGPLGVLGAGRRHQARRAADRATVHPVQRSARPPGSSRRRSWSPRTPVTRCRCSTTARRSAGSTCCRRGDRESAAHPRIRRRVSASRSRRPATTWC